MKIIDIHSHLQFSDFDDDRDSIIAELNSRNWGTIVVGTNAETSQGAVNLANHHDNIWATVGHHPTVLDKVELAGLEAMLLDDIAREKVRIVYENDEIGIEHAFVTFKDGNTQAVMAVFKYKDGKIISLETGATNMPK